jgi:hypothetical protein
MVRPGTPNPGGMSPVPVRMSQQRAQSRRRVAGAAQSR